MKALIMVEIDPFRSSDEPEPKPENYTYALSVMNEVGIPVVFRENRNLILMPQKIESGKIEDGTKTNIPIPVEHFAMGWNACIEEIEKNVRKAEHD